MNEYLQVKGYDNIYAIGDCADVNEPKMAYHAGLHADVAVTNIVNSLTQKPLKTYTPGKFCFVPSCLLHVFDKCALQGVTAPEFEAAILGDFLQSLVMLVHSILY